MVKENCDVNALSSNQTATRWFIVIGLIINIAMDISLITDVPAVGIPLMILTALTGIIALVRLSKMRKKAEVIFAGICVGTFISRIAMICYLCMIKYYNNEDGPSLMERKVGDADL